ncbi:MAG: hypothetical protein Q4A08_00945, partial [Bacteroidales bacterium]|nr:hypothetical protein [Bacteroidales bacterium]
NDQMTTSVVMRPGVLKISIKCAKMLKNEIIYQKYLAYIKNMYYLCKGKELTKYSLWVEY